MKRRAGLYRGEIGGSLSPTAADCANVSLLAQLAVQLAKELLFTPLAHEAKTCIYSHAVDNCS